MMQLEDQFDMRYLETIARPEGELKRIEERLPTLQQQAESILQLRSAMREACTEEECRFSRLLSS